MADHHWVPGRHGFAGNPPGLFARVMETLGVASLAAHRGAVPALTAAAMAAFGLALPATPGFARAPGLRAIWAGPERWLVVAEGDVEAALTEKLGAHATVTDQTDARAVLHVSGSRAADALAKGVGLDLHPRAFQPGMAALTLAADVPILLWQEDAAPTYALAIPRSYAGSVAAWLVASAAEYGLVIEPVGVLLP